MRRHDARGGNTDENVGPGHSICESARLAFEIGEFHHLFLHPVQVGCVFVQNSGFVTENDVWEAVPEQEPADGDSGGAGSIYDDAARFFFLSGHFQGIDDSGEDNDGRPVLVIVEYRDVEQLF